MTRTAWIVLLALYATLAVALVVFLGVSIPPCFGNAQGQMSPECVANWEASRPWFPDRLIEAVGSVGAAAVTFLVLAGGTLVIDLVRRWRRGPTE